jgi:hypothetical protein
VSKESHFKKIQLIVTFEKKYLKLIVHKISHCGVAGAQCMHFKYTPARTIFISGLKSRVLKLPFFS